MDGVERFVGKNSVVDFVFVFTTERRLLEEHLVDKNTKCPPVNCASVLLVQENLENPMSDMLMLGQKNTAYFWCHELRSTTECAGG